MSAREWLRTVLEMLMVLGILIGMAYGAAGMFMAAACMAGPCEFATETREP